MLLNMKIMLEYQVSPDEHMLLKNRLMRNSRSEITTIIKNMLDHTK